MKLYLYPFVWIFLCIGGGIFFSDQVHIDRNPIIFFFVLSTLFIVYISLKRSFFSGWIKYAFFTFSCILFFCIGVFLNRLEVKNEGALSSYTNLNRAYIGVINELKQPKNGYQKCEVSVYEKQQNKRLGVFKSKVILIVELNPLTLKLNKREVIRFFTAFNSIVNDNNPGAFDQVNYWKHKGISYIGFVSMGNLKKCGAVESGFSSYVDRMRDALSKVLDTFLFGQEAALSKALILGDRSDLDTEVTEQFGNTGAMHILAVSGLHIGILVKILTSFFGLFYRWISKTKAIYLALIIIWVYAFITGMSASVVRSVIMFTILSMAMISGRKHTELNSLAFSAVLILAWKPSFLFDVGFQLSYAAMVGIYWFYPFLRTLFYSKISIVRLIWEGTAVGIAAQITTIPFTLYYFNQFPNYFIVTNIALMAFSFLILGGGILLFMCSMIPYLSSFIAFLLQKTVFLMLQIVSWIDSFPFSISSGFVLSQFQSLILTIIVVFFYISLRRRKYKMLILSLIMTLFCSGIIFYNRHQRLNESFTMLLADKKPLFLIRNQGLNFVVVNRKYWNESDTKFVVKSIQKAYPGKVKYINLYRKKRCTLKFDNKVIVLEKKKHQIIIQQNNRSYSVFLTKRKLSMCEDSYPLAVSKKIAD